MINKCNIHKVFTIVFFSFIFINVCYINSNAQSFSYNKPSTFSSIPYSGQIISFKSLSNTYTAEIGTTTYVSNEGAYDNKFSFFNPSNDEGKIYINLAPYNFSFLYNNTNYTHFYLSTNGYLNLSGNQYTYSSDATISGFNNNINEDIIAPSWTDLKVKYVTTKISGVQGSRVLTIEYTCYNAIADLQFQVKLYENSSVIKFIYGDYFIKPNPVFSDLTTDQLSVGLQFKGATSPTNYGLDQFSGPSNLTSITVNGNLTYPYTGSPNGPSNATTLSQGKINYVYYGKGITVYPESSIAPKNLGNYAVIAKVNRDDTYYGQSSEEFPFSIVKATPEISIIGASVYNYIGSPQGPVASTSLSDGVKSYAYSGTGTTTYTLSNTRPIEIGTYQLVASIAEGKNYLSASSSVFNFEIINNTNSSLSPSSIIFSIDKSFTYDGQQHSPLATITGSTATPTYYYAGTGATNYPISTIKPTNSGNYELVVTVDDDLNFYGLTSDAVPFTINQASSTITVTGSTTYNYNGRPQGPKTYLKIGSSTTPITYSYSGTASTTYGPSFIAPIELGAYQVIATLDEDLNYSLANSSPFTFSIVQAPSTITIIGATSYSYNGDAQGPTTSIENGSTATPTYLYAGRGSTIYPSSVNRPINIGTYQVVATVSADANYLGVSSSPFNFVINNLQSSTITITGVSSYNYDGSAHGPTTYSVSGSTATPTFSYSGISPTVYGAKSIKPSAAGVYQVIGTVGNDANYNGASSDPFIFTIIGTSNPVLSGGGDFNYSGIALYTDDYDNLTDGDLFINIDKNGSTGAVGYTFTGINTTNYPASKSAPTLPGSYTVTATVAADKSHEQAISNSLGFNILSITTDIGIQNDDFYDYTGAPIGPTTAIVYYMGEVVNALVVDFVYTGIGNTSYGPNAIAPSEAGTYKVMAKVNDLVYSGTSSFLNFSILAPSTIIVTGTSTFTYNSTPQGPITSTINGSTISPTYNYSGTGTTDYGPTNMLPTEVGTYQVIATVAANDIYKTANSDPFSFTIINNLPSSTITVTGENSFNYNGQRVGPNTFIFSGSTATPYFSYSGVSPTTYGPSLLAPINAGTYQVIATLTGDDNYNGSSSDPFLFAIVKEKTKIEYPSTTIDYTYNGTAQGPAIDFLSIVGSTATPTAHYTGLFKTNYDSYNLPVESGNYQVVFGVEEDDNYNNAYLSPLSFTINLISTSITITGTTDFYYNTNAQGPSLHDVILNSGPDPNFYIVYAGINGTIYNESVDPPILPGTYSATAFLTWQQANPSYSDASSEVFNFTIHKGIPTVQIVGTSSYLYRGSEQGPILLNSNSYGAKGLTYTGVGGTIFGPSTSRPVNVGNYKVIGTIAESQNYVSAITSDFNFSIDQDNSGKQATTISLTGKSTYKSSAPNPHGISTEIIATIIGSTATPTYTYKGLGTTDYPTSTSAPIMPGHYEVVVTVDGDDNFYDASSSVFQFSIKYNPALNWNSLTSFFYDGTAIGPDDINSESDGKISFQYTGINSTVYSSTSYKPIDAGEYTATALVSETDNFLSTITDGVNNIPSLDFTIYKGQANIQLNQNSVSSFIYTGAGIGLDINSLELNGFAGTYSITYTSTDGDYYSSSQMPINVGSYNLNISSEGNNNYNTFSFDFGYTINKAPTSISITVNNSFVYDGSPQGQVNAEVHGSNELPTYIYSGTGSTTYEQSDIPPTEVGTYQVIASVEADQHYIAASSLPFNFFIKYLPTPVLSGDRDYNYSGIALYNDGSGNLTDGDLAIFLDKNGSTGVVTFLFSGVGSTTYESNTIPPTLPGTYAVCAVVAEDPNYFRTKSTPFNFNILSKSAIFSFSSTNKYKYTGLANGPTSVDIFDYGTGNPIIVTAIDYFYSGVGLTNYSPSSTRPLALGSYQMVARIADSIYSGSSEVFNFSILPVSTISVTGSTEYTYSANKKQGPITSAVYGSTATPTYSYSGVSPTIYNASAIKPVNAGRYQVIATVADNDYYFGASSAPFNFAILKTSTISVTGDSSYIFNDSSQGPATSIVTGSTATPTYTYTGVDTTIYISSSIPPVKVGKYIVVGKVVASGDYLQAVSANFAFSIKPVKVVVDTIIKVPVVIDTLKKDSIVKPPVIIDTIIKIPVVVDTLKKDSVIKPPVIIDTLIKVPVVIDTLIKVPIVIDSVNKSIIIIDTSGNVVLKNKEASSIIIVDTSYFTYNGTTQGPASVKVIGSTGAVSYTYSKPPINVGNYFVIAKVEADSNFLEAISDTLRFTIHAATLVISPNGISRCFNTKDPEFSYTIKGYVNKEDSSVLLKKPIVFSSVTNRSLAGTYSITSDSAFAENYLFKYNTALYTIYPLPIVKVIAGADFLCDGSDLILKSTGGTKYVWYKNNDVILGAGDSLITIKSFGNYSSKAFSEFGCEAMASNTLAVKQYYAPTPIFETKYSCVNLPVLVTNQSITNASGVVSFSWEDGAGNSLSKVEPKLQYNSVGIKKIQLTITPNSCPALERTIIKEIIIEAPVEATRMKSINTIINEPLSLLARNIGKTFAWTIVNKNSLSSIILNDSSIYNPILTTNGETELNVAITSENSCVTVDTVLVRIFKEEKVYLPNSFSPNGDGINDEFKLNPVGISTLNYFRIFDQWGKMIFETANLSIGWDGKLNGVSQPLASYTWMVDAIDIYQNRIKKVGIITLIR